MDQVISMYAIMNPYKFILQNVCIYISSTNHDCPSLSGSTCALLSRPMSSSQFVFLIVSLSGVGCRLVCLQRAAQFCLATACLLLR